jgi:spermidine synthase
VELSVPGPHPVVIVGGGLGDVLHVELSVPGPHPVVIVPCNRELHIVCSCTLGCLQ